MQAQQDEFTEALDRFERRAIRLSPLALTDPEEDTDERAAMTMLMSSAFERFLREVTRACVDAISLKVSDFSSLPKVIRKAHYEGGASELQSAVRRDWTDVNAGRAIRFTSADDVVARLLSVTSTPYSLVWEGFARTDSNAGPDTVIAILKRFDIDKPWVTLEAGIPPGVYPAPPPGPARANQLNAELVGLRDARNRCAHGAAGVAAPQWSTLLEAIVALRAVAAGLVGVLTAKLASLP